jgi:hypothetical protein
MHPLPITEKVEALPKSSRDAPREFQSGGSGTSTTNELRNGPVRNACFALDVAERLPLLLAQGLHTPGEVFAEGDVFVVRGVPVRVAGLLDRHCRHRGHVTAATLAARLNRGTGLPFSRSIAPLT